MAVGIWDGIPGEYEHFRTDCGVRDDCFDSEDVEIPAVEIATGEYRLTGSEGEGVSDSGFTLNLITPLGVERRNTVCIDLYEQTVDMYDIDERREDDCPEVAVWERNVQRLPQTGCGNTEFILGDDSAAGDCTIVQALPANILTIEGSSGPEEPRLKPHVTAHTRLLVSLARAHGWFEPTVSDGEYEG